MKRILIIGTSCTGKTTAARGIGQALNAPWFDLDDFNWMPGWQERPVDEFRALVQKTIDENPSWVFCGNYSKLGGIVGDAADTVIWLDYSFLRVLWQFLKRTTRRVFLKEPCCNGNNETFLRLFTKDSLLLWILKTYSKNKRTKPEQLAAYRAQGKSTHTFKNPREMNAFIASLSHVLPAF